jgi:transcriptional regulator with XRE-family HTH domain
MLPQILPNVEGNSVISLIKECSGRRIEARRRRDRISQRKLAAIVGCSPRWLREIEAGIATSALEDHIRCAHALGMSTAHIFLPLLFVEHNMPVPRELLMLEDLWDVERACLSILHEHQSAAQSRHALRAVLANSPRG